MLEKKYQVFISSTFTDLVEARRKVRDAILSMYHFPVGMELFGAANEEQWQISIGRLLAGILEQGADLDAVCSLSIQLPALRHHRQRQANTYQYRHTPFQFFNLLIL